MKTVFIKRIFSLAVGLALLAFYSPRISADENSSDVSGDIDMVTGDIESVPANGLTRVSVTNPEVADISDAQTNKVSILAKKAGETVLFLWDTTGKHSVKVRVAGEDLSAVKARVQKILEEANISGITLVENLDEGKVVLTGTLSKEDKDRADETLQPYSDNLLNLVQVEKSQDLIQVDMQVIEISTTLEENLGIQWSNASGTNQSTSTSTGTGTGAGLSLPYTETPPKTDGKIKDFFKIGDFNRTFQLQATVNALLQEGKAKLISKPRLVVVSGKQASFLVGGEIPVQSTTISASGGTSQSNTTYTEYGVNMTVNPTIRDGKIDIVLNVDIRDVDNSSSFSGSTGNTVAFITRNASTDLLMDNKQTLALAGLIKYSASENLTEVPFLSKVPILGTLFRNRSTPGDSNTEMVIILTPTILTDRKYSNKEITMPTVTESEAYKAFDQKYEHNPLPTWPVPKDVPPAAASSASVSPTDPVALSAYARTVQFKISKMLTYPQGKEGSVSMAGTVKLKLHILKDGSLNSEEITESSGNDVLDQDALHAAKTAAPYDAFTMGIGQDDLIFTIPIVYNKLIAQK